MLLRLYLLNNDLDIVASQDNKYEFVINLASGTLKFDGIFSWLASSIGVILQKDPWHLNTWQEGNKRLFLKQTKCKFIYQFKVEYHSIELDMKPGL
jgi:hypothetical protein